MINLLEHLKEMKSQAELVDDWQKAFDVAISLCTKKDTVIADLQSENEELQNQGSTLTGMNIELDNELQALQEKYDKLKERVEGAPTLELTVIDDSVYAGTTEDGLLEEIKGAFGDGQGQTIFRTVALLELTPEEMEMNDE